MRKIIEFYLKSNIIMQVALTEDSNYYTHMQPSQSYTITIPQGGRKQLNFVNIFDIRKETALKDSRTEGLQKESSH